MSMRSRFSNHDRSLSCLICLHASLSSLLLKCSLFLGAICTSIVHTPGQILNVVHLPSHYSFKGQVLFSISHFSFSFQRNVCLPEGMQKTRRCGAMLPCKEEVFVNHNTWAPINHPLEVWLVLLYCSSACQPSCLYN